MELFKHIHTQFATRMNAHLRMMWKTPPNKPRSTNATQTRCVRRDAIDKIFPAQHSHCDIKAEVDE